MFKELKLKLYHANDILFQYTAAEIFCTLVFANK